jgi:hypothetical protein
MKQQADKLEALLDERRLLFTRIAVNEQPETDNDSYCVEQTKELYDRMWTKIERVISLNQFRSY